MEREHPSWERWQAELAGSRPAPARRQVGLHDDPDAYAAVGLALWLDAWLKGAASLDDAADHVASGDAVHLVDTGNGAEPLIVGLGRLRAAGAVAAGAALPVPGDPVGLAGPPGFNQAALEAEEAVRTLLRWAGDEFLVLLPTATEAQAVVVMERLRAAVAAADWSDLRLTEPVTVSVGVATAPEVDDEQPEPVAGWRALFDTADLLLFSAKRSGRNRVRAPGGGPVDGRAGA